MKKTTLPVARIQDRDHGNRDANLANMADERMVLRDGKVVDISAGALQG